MGELKTKRTATGADEFLQGVTDDARRRDCVVLIDMMRRVTGAEPDVWSSGAVGFGTYHYKYSSGQEGEWFPVGFASRKASLVVYLGPGLEYPPELLSKLGTYKTGKGCLYIKRLEDIDLELLKELVSDSFARIRQTYG